MSHLSNLRCSACEGTESPLSPDQYQSKLDQLWEWKVRDEKVLRKSYHMKTFSSVMQFVNAIAKIAEEEGHHPDLHITGYNNLLVELSTHAIGGLSDNDFIMAAKIDAINA